jgi:hypothetical protein
VSAAAVSHAALLLAAMVHWLPLPGLAGAAQLQSLYGLGVLEPSTVLLLQHRALLFPLLSLPLLGALWRRRALLPGAGLLLISDLGFALLALGHWPLGPALQPVWLLDLLSIALLVLGLLLARRPARAKAQPD